MVDLILGLYWIIYAACFIALTTGLAHAALQYAGTFRWPIPGRWLLTVNFFFLSALFITAILHRLHAPLPFLADTDYNRDLVRLAVATCPVVTLPWLVVRIFTQGLLDDYEDRPSHVA
jgi:hypothetical protein